MLSKFTQIFQQPSIRKTLNTQPLYKFCLAQKPMFISAQEASKYLNDKNTKFLDVRDIEEYKKTHIAAKTYSGDMYFWYRSGSDKAEISQLRTTFQDYMRENGFNKNDYIIAYEDSLDSRKGASCRAYYLLKLFGHQQVSVINGGLQAWNKLSLPMTSEVQPVQKGDFVAEWHPEFWACKEHCLTQLKTAENKHVFLDVRDDEEWLGESSSPLGKDFVPKKGRIEGAVWIPWYKFMTPNQDGLVMINEPQVVEQQLKSVGITSKDTPITVYCFKGARASNTFMALKNAGYNNIKNYFGSWNEWATDPLTPYDAKVLSQ